MKLKKLLCSILVLTMLVSTMSFTVFAEETTSIDATENDETQQISPSGEPSQEPVEVKVAKVGETEYSSIDEAIANWTHGTTLTLLSDVTLSDVVTLKSTEHHILNLGTYTMTAASGKNAFEIIASGTGAGEQFAITIKADADNPGTLDAGNKSCIYYDYSKGTTSGDDRPIIVINSGILKGSTSSFGTGGIYTKGTAARKCATINISGGTFDCSIIGTGKSKLLISGGTFNYTVSSQGDSTCYRLISGGRFKSFGFMTADSNNTKFWIGTDMNKSDVGVYVDDEEYLVVGGPVITEPGNQFAASIGYSKWSYLLQYSSAAANRLYCTDVNYALNKDKNVIIYASALTDEEKVQPITSTGNLTVDMTENSYTGDVTLGNANATFTVIFDTDNPYTGKVTPYTGYALNITETMGTIVTRTYSNTEAYVKRGEKYYVTLQEALDEAEENDTIEILKEISEGTIKLPSVIKNLTIEGNGTAVIKDTTIQAADGSSINYDGITFNGIIFDNSNIVMTGWRANEVYKDLAFTNNQFKNIVRTSNYAAIHLNNSTEHPIEGLTITGNIIDGVSGASNSGIYTTAIDGEIVVENNTIKNVAFRPFVLQITNNNGTADTVTVKGNTFSDSPVGRLQIVGTDDEGEDAVHVAINRNIVHEVTGNYELCCWDLNDEKTTSDISGNYWGAGVIDNANDFYWNNGQSTNEDLVDLGIFPIYTRLTSEGKIDETSIVTGIDYAVAKVGERMYSSLKTAFEKAENGSTITLVKDISLNETIKVNADDNITLDLDGHTVTGTDSASGNFFLIDSYGDLTVKNGTITLTAENNREWNAASAIFQNRGGKLVIESGTYVHNGGTAMAYVVDNNANSYGDATTVVNDGNLKSSYIAIRNRMDTYGANGGGNGEAILDINGGKFEGKYAIWGQVASAGVKGTIDISGGTFTAQDGKAAVLVDTDTTGDAKTAISGGTFSSNVSDYAAEGFDCVRMAEGYVVIDEELQADSISVEYKDVTVEGTEGEKTYEIVIKANDDDIINELASVDFSFVFGSSPYNGGNIDFDVLPADGFTMTKHEDAEEYPERYMFNYNGVGKNYQGTGNAITVGTITVTGYGSFTIATADVTTNVVNTTTVNDNLVDSYTAAGATDNDATTGELVINKDTIKNDGMKGEIKGDDAVIAVPVRTLKITIDFPNAVNDNVKAYQDMKVEISGNIDGENKTVTYDLGEGAYAMDNGSYVVTENKLVLNESYTVKVSGAGYRTARYTVRMTEDKELKFWNNVMDEAQFVEIGKDSSKVNVTFLAGDIVKDNKINIYDLSAVVSYFGTNTNENAYDEYAKYDLNRDGVIDSKDVAYVLVSWGN